MKITVKNLKVDWLAIKNACRKTVNLGDNKIEPTDEWKKKLLIAEHSPIRRGTLTIDLEEIPYFVHTHLVRHNVGVTPFVSTSRSDRTGIPREEKSQVDPVNMELDLNLQSLINISAKRLCYQADPQTRKIWEDVIVELYDIDPMLAWACVPQCIRYSGCPEEFGNCKFFEKFIENLSKEELIDMKRRYEAYNESRNLEKKLAKKKMADNHKWL